MCVEVKIEVAEVEEKLLNKITDQIEKHVELWFCGKPGGKAKKKAFVRTISEPQMCGCTLIDGEIDCFAQYWNFRSEIRPQIAKMIQDLSREAQLRCFQASWRGTEGPKESEVHTSIENLLDIIRKNKIKPEVKYLISA